MEKTYKRKLNKLLYFGGILLLVCLIFFTLKYLNLYTVLIKTLKAVIPVVIAVFISFLVEPLILKLTNLKIKRVFAVILVYLMFYGVLIGIIVVVTPLIIKNLSLFMERLPKILKDLENILNCWIKNVHIDIDISKAIPPIDNAHLGKYFNIASKTFDAGFYISLVVVGSIFLSFDYQNFKKGIKSFLPTKHKEKIERYFMEFLPFIHKYVKGIFIDSLVVFAMGLITFFVFGYKNAIFFAILLGISNCIPLFGPYISGIPIVLISFLTSTQSGITALIIIVVIQVIDGNIIQPLIMKNILYLHPLENVLGISVLTTLFGLIGMILSPIVVTSIKILSKHIRLNKDERKKELEEFKKINKNPLN